MKINNVQSNQQNASFKARLVTGTAEEVMLLEQKLAKLLPKRVPDAPFVRRSSYLNKDTYIAVTNANEIEELLNIDFACNIGENKHILNHKKALKRFVRLTADFINYNNVPTPISKLLKEIDNPKFDTTFNK